MNCPHCGHPDISTGATHCPQCQQSLRQAPTTRIDVNADIGSMQESEFAGVKIERVDTIILNTFGVTSNGQKILTPVGTHYEFIGRQKELESLVQALREGRIVQIYGLGGIGKTSLAAETTERLWTQKVFLEGSLWVSEVGSADLPFICDAIARHLQEERIPKLPIKSKPDAIRELLAGHQKLLIVLDHIESPATVRQFVDRCLPEGMVLLTTGRIKHLASDTDLQVPPLERNDAIALFKSRAQLDNDPALDPIINEICSLLADHALAIVIAAGRVRAESLPLDSLKRRLANAKSRIKSLQLGTGTDREHSLRASLDLSYQHLNEKERQVFQSLAACFSESTSLPVLAEICGLEEFECEDIGGHLVRRSLLERRGNRYYMQHLVRDFGRFILGESLMAIQDKAFQTISAYTERYKGNNPEDFDHLENELGNLLSAVQWAFEHDRCAEAIALVKIIARPVSGVLGVRGYWSQLVAVGRLGMKAAEACSDQRAVAHLAQYVAIILQRQDSYSEAREVYQRSLEIYEQLNDRINIAVATHHVGMLSLAMCRYPKAKELFIKSRGLYQAEGDEIGASRSIHELGRLAFIQGDYLEAKKLFSESLVIKEAKIEKPDRRGIALVLSHLGDIAREQGDWREAQGLYARSQEFYANRKDPYGIAAIASRFGMIERERGNYSEAQRLLAEAGMAFEKLVDQGSIAENHLNLGRLRRDLVQLEASQTLLQKSLEIYSSIKHPSGTAWSQLELAWLALQIGNEDEAHRLLRESQAIFEKGGEKLGFARGLHLLGRVAFSAKDNTQAVDLTERSRVIHEEMKVRPWIARDLHQLGLYAASQGDLTVAHQRLEEALELYQSLGLASTDSVKADLAKLE